MPERKTAIVTGSTSGVGLGIARALAQSGMNVMLNGFEDARTIYDGRLEPGMVMCVESYTGEVGGHEGVKLEQMVLVTEGGPILLSTFPFEDILLS